MLNWKINRLMAGDAALCGTGETLFFRATITFPPTFSILMGDDTATTADLASIEAILGVPMPDGRGPDGGRRESQHAEHPTDDSSQRAAPACGIAEVW